jgi:carboxylesterase
MEWNEPLYREGSNVGVLVIHGFTGSPRSMHEYGLHLADAGLTVALPLLTGHGNTVETLEKARWTDWTANVETAYAWLQERTDRVFATGLSMGGTLAVWLAEHHPELAGVVTVNAALDYGPREWMMHAFGACGIPRYLKAVGNDIKKPGEDECAYDRLPTRATRQFALLLAEVRRHLHLVHCPALVFSSKIDHTVPTANQQALYRGLGSATKRLVMLEDSYHVATMDHDKERIFAGTLDFIREHADGA